MLIWQLALLQNQKLAALREDSRYRLAQALVDPKEFAGKTLVYLPKYLTPEDPAFALSDREVGEIFIQALEQMYSHFHRSDLLSFQVSRVKYVLAISTLNYSQCLPPMQTSIPGVQIVNSSHILNGTLNVNETVQLAENCTLDQ